MKVYYIGNHDSARVPYVVNGLKHILIVQRKCGYEVPEDHAKVLLARLDGNEFTDKKPEGARVRRIKPKTEKEDLRAKLRKMSMKKIREFVEERGLSARDTDKEELIEEIIIELKGGNG